MGYGAGHRDHETGQRRTLRDRGSDGRELFLSVLIMGVDVALLALTDSKGAMGPLACSAGSVSSLDWTCVTVCVVIAGRIKH